MEKEIILTESGVSLESENNKQIKNLDLLRSDEQLIHII